jgi:hypothetical protein
MRGSAALVGGWPGRPDEDCPSRIIAGIPDQSIEDPFVISKLLMWIPPVSTIKVHDLKK